MFIGKIRFFGTLPANIRKKKHFHNLFKNLFKNISRFFQSLFAVKIPKLLKVTFLFFRNLFQTKIPKMFSLILQFFRVLFKNIFKVFAFLFVILKRINIFPGLFKNLIRNIKNQNKRNKTNYINSKFYKGFSNSFRYLRDFNALHANRINIFLILIILFIIVSPFLIKPTKNIEAKSQIINLFLSLQGEELMSAEMAEELINEFNENNPDIIVRLFNFEISTVAQITETRQNRDSAFFLSPDIMIFNESDFRDLASVNMLADLNYYYNIVEPEIIQIEEDQYDEETSIPDVIEISITSGLAVPLVSFMDMLFYNIDILSAAGFDHPPKTRNEFLASIRAVNRRNISDTMGAVLSLSNYDRQGMSRDIFSWIWAAGGNFRHTDNKLLLTSALYNTRAVADDITFIRDYIREVETHGIFDKTGNQRIEEFAQGRIALMIASTQYIPYLREQMGDNAFGITNIPSSGTGGFYNIALSSIYAGINSDSKHPAEAWRFIKFLNEKKSFFCTELSAVPGSITNPIAGDYVRNDIFYHKAWDIFEVSQIINGFSGKPEAEKYEKVFMEELQVFINGGRTALQTVTVIERRWDEIKKIQDELDNLKLQEIALNEEIAKLPPWFSFQWQSLRSE